MEWAIVIGIILVLVALAVALVYNIVQYVKVKNQLLGEKEVRDAAKKEVSKLRYKDPIISCDYCGSKIDTRKHRVCPGCGASYYRDEEWTSRYEVSEGRMDKISGKMMTNLEKKKAESATLKEKLRKIRRRIIVCAIPLGLAIITFSAAFFYAIVFDYRGNEELNDDDNYSFSEASYQVEGDGVIYDDGKVTVKITGIYVDAKDLWSEKYGSYGAVKIRFLVQNRLKKRVTISMQCRSMSGVTSAYRGFVISDKFRKNSETTIYETVSYVPLKTISEMVITDIDLYDGGSYRKKIAEPVVIATTAEPPYIPETEGAKLVFSNEKADIYSRYNEAEHAPASYVLYIVNKTGTYVEVENDGTLRDGAKSADAFFYRLTIPEGYTFVSDDEWAAKGGKESELQVSFLFRFTEDPTMSFSTGYLKIEK